MSKYKRGSSVIYTEVKPYEKVKEVKHKALILSVKGGIYELLLLDTLRKALAIDAELEGLKQ